MKKNKKMPALVLAVLLAASLSACDENDSASGIAAGSPGSSSPPSLADLYPQDSVLRLNQIQVLGSHNSYHSGPIMAGDALEPILSINALAQFANLLGLFNYRHPTLATQLDLGVRQFEFDVWADPSGGAYSNVAVSASSTVSRGIPALDNPGLKVMHVAGLDPYSSCISFKSCLQEIKSWSDAHPGHAPLMIMVEIKDEDTFLTAPGLQVWAASDYDTLDAEILSVFPAEKIITPDNVQGSHVSLNEAVLAGEWPTLAQSRGKVMFTNCACLSDRHRTDYLRADGSLSGRVMFTNSKGMADGSPANAFYVVDDPVNEAATISALLAQGYLVRTQIDVYGVQDEARRDAGFASGAQFVGTDYEQANALNKAPTYQVGAPGEPARCNPVAVPASASCTPRDIENPEALAYP